MKTITAFLLLLIFFSFLNGQELSITVTNQNLALVKEIREINLQKGIGEFTLTGVPQLIDPTSVHIQSLKNHFDVLEQNYEFDLLNADKILNKSIEQKITITHPESETMKGKLLYSDSRNIILETDSGELRIIPRNVNQHILIEEFNKEKSGFITRPTLIWLLDAENNGQSTAELSYLTSGLNWHAEYVAILSENEKSINLSSWVSLDNRSGKTYRDTRLKLMAGDIHRVTERQKSYDRHVQYEVMATKAAPQQFTEKEFFEYHLYTLGRQTTIKNNQTKQIQLFEPANVKTQKIFSYNHSKDAKKVSVLISFKNKKESGLGIPLPAGLVRIFKKDGKDIEFIGENKIDHTPKDELIEIETGKAFDIRAERIITESRKLSKRSEEQEVEILFKNHKDDDIEIVVTEQIWRYRKYKLQESNILPFEQDANKMKFKVPVKANDEAKLVFKILYNW